MRIATGLTGTAGEYFVAAELSLRGWLATVTIKNAPGIDVLAMDTETKRSVAIQTKTASVGKAFTLKEEDQRISPSDASEWYVLVGLTAPPEARQRPSFYVMPTNAVAIALHLHHQHYLGNGGEPGSKRRTLRRDWAPLPFLERWDLLKKHPSEALALIPDWYRPWAAEFGLPDGLEIPSPIDA